MLSTSRSRVRALAALGMTAVVATVGAVTNQASATELAAPSQVGAYVSAVEIPAIDVTIKPPAHSRPIGVYRVVSGTQNYTCVVPDGEYRGAYTGLSTPEARLMGTGGPVHHFGGPSWRSERDKSLVTAVKKTALARGGTIPELLLQVISHSGHGIMDKADYISRLATSGGVAPAGSCAPGDVARVSYRAVYVFWDAPDPARDADAPRHGRSDDRSGRTDDVSGRG